jgi:hypothetical protein
MKYIVLLFLCLPACAQTWFSNISIKPVAYGCYIGWTTAVPTIAHIEYGPAAGSYTKTNANSTAYWHSKTEMITPLNAGTTYHFKIVASDTSADWIFSHDYTCTTPTTTTATPPPVPTPPPTSHSVKLNWQASASTGVSGYQVYRSTVAGGFFGLLGSVAGLTYTDQSVQAGTTYYYAIKAQNSSGALSGFSNQVQAAVP